LLGQAEPSRDCRSQDWPSWRGAGAGLAVGGGELLAAEQAARRIIEAEPFRESAHALLMEVLAVRGDVARALRVYDDLRGYPGRALRAN
jgi:hypothetical protein